MACDVARSPLDTNLDAIVDFNSTFGDGDGDGVNPQMLSNPPTPNSDFGHTFSVNDIDQTFSPEPTALGAYASPTNFASTPGPYFQSIEATSPFASHLRFDNRQRSISEPPDGFFQHHNPVQNDGQVTFHRGGHFLGDPQPRSLKSLPRGKQNFRAQPYKNKSGRQQEQFRQQLRRTQTQPMRPPPPTSMPHPMQPHPFLPQNRAFEPMPMLHEQKYMSSRVCTPASEHAIDPALGQEKKVEALTVPLTVEQLRALITEAVQKAVKGLEKRDAVEQEGGEKVQVVDSTEQAFEGDVFGEDSKGDEAQDFFNFEGEAEEGKC